MYAITWLLIGIYSTSTVVGEIARLPFVIMPLNCIFSFHGYMYSTHLSDDNHNHLLALFIIGSLKYFSWGGGKLAELPVCNIPGIQSFIYLKKGHH